MQTLASPIHSIAPSFQGTPSLMWVNKLFTNRVAYHVVFWFFIFGFSAAYISFIGEDREVSLYNLALRIPFIVFCCYANLYVLMPKFYYTGKLLLYVTLVLSLIFCLNALNLFLLEAFVESPICPTTFEADATFNSSNYLYKSFYLFTLVGLTSGIKLSKSHYVEKQKADAIEKEKLQTELSFLKSQIQPHFFFNTLNNLYALTIKKSDLAPDMLLKLSDLMSYGLYEAESTSVPCEREMEHIRNYIELESLRLGSRFKIQFEVTGNLENKSMPPLLFLPFIENCFKHSTPGGVHNTITILIAAGNSEIRLHTSNPFKQSVKTSTDKKGGLGLKNSKRRLQLLYGTNYKVEFQEIDELYQVSVVVPLV
ncbi:MAG: sensor histidine kinase [Flammeovirgaceae bacterium]